MTHPHIPSFLFVDTAVQDREILLAGVNARTRTIPLSPAGDPLGQIADLLTGLTGVQRLTIMSHGGPGYLRLAGHTVNLEALSQAAPYLSRIKAALGPDAEVLLVACETGAGTAGATFTSTLENALGVPVHGAAAPLGGDAGWDALAHAPALFSADARNAYPHRLAVINGSGGADDLGGTADADTIDGGADNDTISGLAGNDSLLGGDGNDLFIFTSGNLTPDDTVNGGAGSDTIQVTGTGDLSSGSANITNIELITGSTGADAIAVTTSFNISAGDGNDILVNAGTAATTLAGEGGRDTLSSTNANDSLFGGSGDDVLRAGGGADEFPAFFCRNSGLRVPLRLDNPEEVAAAWRAGRDLGLENGMLITNPVPEEHALDRAAMERIIDDALFEAKRTGAAGKLVTPYLLAQIRAATGGASLSTNIELVRANARLGAEIARHFARD